MSRDELKVMDGGKCILEIRGARPFYIQISLILPSIKTISYFPTTIRKMPLM